MFRLSTAIYIIHILETLQLSSALIKKITKKMNNFHQTFRGNRLMIGGYAGKMLFVDLTKGLVEEQELTDELAEKFIGGYGIGAKVLYDRMPAGADPLGPDSVLGFVTGPSNGTNAF